MARRTPCRGAGSGANVGRLPPLPPPPAPAPFLGGLPTLLALGEVALPFALGLVAGMAFGRRGTRHGAVVIAVAALLVGLPFLVAPFAARLGLYDPLWIDGWLAAGFALGTRAGRGGLRIAGVLTTMVTVAVGLGGLEAWSRRLPPTPGTSLAELDHLTVAPEEREPSCRAVFPDEVPGPPFVNAPPAGFPPKRPGVRRIVYLGDSMVEADDVPPEARFPAVLGARHPDEEHLNLGISDTGVDVTWAVYERWSPRLAPDEVVLSLSPANDLRDQDRPSACCDAGPLLAFDGATPRLRCDRPVWRVPLERLLDQGPPPYTLRVLAQSSALARRAYWGLLARGARDRRGAAPQLWATIDALMRRIRADGRVLRVVVMPHREAMTGGPRRLTDGLRLEMLARARAAGVEPLDAWALFEPVVDVPGMFQPFPTNPHFDVPGHRRLADAIDARRSQERPPSAP